MNCMKRQKGMTLKDELPGQQVPNMLLEKSREIAPEEQRNSTRRNEKAESKQKQCLVEDVSDGESKV